MGLVQTKTGKIKPTLTFYRLGGKMGIYNNDGQVSQSKSRGCSLYKCLLLKYVEYSIIHFALSFSTNNKNPAKGRYGGARGRKLTVKGFKAGKSPDAMSITSAWEA